MDHLVFAQLWTDTWVVSMVWLLSNVLEYLCGCMLSVAHGHEPQSGIAGPRGGSVSDELTKAGLSPTMAAPFLHSLRTALGF